MQLEKDAKAKTHFETALKLAEQHGSDKLKKDILRKLASCCKRADPVCYQRYLEEFLHISEKTEGRNEMMFINNEVAATKFDLLGSPPDTE